MINLVKSILKKFVIKPIHIVIGFFLFRSPAWKHIRKNCFNFPGKNFHAEIRKISWLLYHLNRAYYAYFEFKYRNLPQREWQKIHWDDYGSSYYSVRKSQTLNEDFLRQFSDMARETETVIEIGCGGFVLTRHLAGLHPGIKFNAYDISDESLNIYKNELQSDFTNIEFFQKSIFEDIGSIYKNPYFYTYNVLMHFDESDINEFFASLADIETGVTGIIQEHYSKDDFSVNYKDRDYRHNYHAYFRKYNFRLIEFTESAENAGVFYFCTK